EQQALEKERQHLDKTVNSPRLLKSLLKKEIINDAKKYGDERRSPLVERASAHALDTTALIPNEPLTIILSQKGWIRAAKGHDIEVSSLSYRAGDGFFKSVKGRSTQAVYILDSTGRIYSTSTHNLASARSQGEPLTGRLNPPMGASFTQLLVGKPEDWYLLASDAGYGFRVQLKEFQSKNKAGKSLVSLPKNATLLSALPIEATGMLMAVITMQGRLLIFSVDELPALARGKGNKIIQIATKDFTAKNDAIKLMTLLADATQPLKIISGKRHLMLKAIDIERYYSTRAKRGALLPRGFQRVDQLISEPLKR
ncbi:MAG: DNA topoisomerase IV subunit A, partial [Methylococcales bacterium]|nr:DNA topoisomerase IV subunit A [Methylococcales bacterium]